MPKQTPHQQFIHLLQKAYSGEMAAALAYRGHWRSLPASAERDRIQHIEREEWRHRRGVGAMLRKLEAEPQQAREILMYLIGHVVGLLCHASGRFWPMYIAGKLERDNVREYDHAAACAGRLSLTKYEKILRRMGEVEREHELYFTEVIADHWFLLVLRRLSD
jgi:demethoxyubiquinone hydroxylase (CLK1/Coq7/Cat5 family)